MSKGIKRKKSSQGVDQKISQKEGREEGKKKESRDITGIIKRQEHQARERRMIHLNVGLKRQRPLK